MTYDNLMAKINEELATNYEDSCGNVPRLLNAVRAIAELHREDVGLPTDEIVYMCDYCKTEYPCSTIKAIQNELR